MELLSIPTNQTQIFVKEIGNVEDCSTFFCTCFRMQVRCLFGLVNVTSPFPGSRSAYTLSLSMTALHGGVSGNVQYCRLSLKGFSMENTTDDLPSG
ncbi:hypothetical protein GDO78_007733 [Eleutherodactylus coqui]|uniref:Uncharacterized protein n=1 Tax=Eleutherodactylus coqui TaxID=57060 RepID=A0A8J6KBQ7_ELECQ|nr:hypothetical protein GDO78_007733 [Eleutherodactylus coqui]